MTRFCPSDMGDAGDIKQGTVDGDKVSFVEM